MYEEVIRRVITSGRSVQVSNIQREAEMRQTSVVLVLIAVLLLSTAIAVGQTEPQYGGTLTIASSQTFRGFNPMFDRENYSAYVINQIFDDLICLDPDTLEPAPYLAD